MLNCSKIKKKSSILEGRKLVSRGSKYPSTQDLYRKYLSLVKEREIYTVPRGSEPLEYSIVSTLSGNRKRRHNRDKDERVEKHPKI